MSKVRRKIALNSATRPSRLHCQVHAALAGYTVRRLCSRAYRITDANGKALNNCSSAGAAWREGYHVLQHRLETTGRA